MCYKTDLSILLSKKKVIHINPIGNHKNCIDYFLEINTGKYLEEKYYLLNDEMYFLSVLR